MSHVVVPESQNWKIDSSYDIVGANGGERIMERSGED